METRKPTAPAQKETTIQKDTLATPKPDLPSYESLVALFTKIVAEKLKNTGKADISQLDEPRKSQLTLIDSTIYYLNNPEMMRTDEVWNKLKEMDLKDRALFEAIENINHKLTQQEVLLGIMIGVRDAIGVSYNYLSPERSYVFRELNGALANINEADQRYCVTQAVNYFAKNNIIAIVGPKSLSSLFTFKRLVKEFLFNAVANEFSGASPDGTAPIVSKVEPQPFSLFNLLTFGMFNTSANPNLPVANKVVPVTATAEVNEKEQQVARPGLN